MKRDSLDSVVSPDGAESYEDDDYEDDDFDDPKSPQNKSKSNKVSNAPAKISSKPAIPDRFEPKKNPSIKKSQEKNASKVETQKST